MGAVESKVTTLRAWSGTPETAKEPFPQLNVPQAGFLIIEAENLDEVFYTHTYGEAIGNRSSTDG